MYKLIIFAFTTLLSSPLFAQTGTDVYCGFSEKIDYPELNISLPNINPNGEQLVYVTSYGHEVNVLVSVSDSLFIDNKIDLNLLVISSTGGGFYNANSTGLSPSENKTSSVYFQLPMPRKDGGLYFVKVVCAI